MTDVKGLISRLGIVPVAVLEDKSAAVPLAAALRNGGLPCAEITLRTAAGLDSIAAIAQEGTVAVGAGSVLTLDQCRDAISAGARFVVSPGFSARIVEYCLGRDVLVIPGCITSSEIMAAVELGLDTVKFFPAGVLGGLSAIKALAGPFPGIQYLPTGGVNGTNLSEYLSSPLICAVGGSWLCTQADIREGKFDHITDLCRQARGIALGYQVAHIGINQPDRDASMAVCDKLASAFGFHTKIGNSSNFASGAIEVLNGNYLGANGHIAIYTNSATRAVYDLEEKGFSIAGGSEKYQGQTLTAVYLEDEMGGFAIHLLQK